MEENRYLLVDPKVLPPVFEGVIRAKELLATGQVTSAAAAAKAAGISRSAFYKYKDFVFKYSAGSADTLNINALLSDRAGVFSAYRGSLQLRCKYRYRIAGTARKRNSQCISHG